MSETPKTGFLASRPNLSITIFDLGLVNIEAFPKFVQIQHYAWPNLGSNGLQRLSADNTCGHGAKAVPANARPFFRTKAEQGRLDLK